MILKSLELKNFRQFYGTQHIKFSVDPNKNITLIHAENGVGKTALLNSILWCFYKRTTPNFSIPTQLINNWAKKENKNSFYVHVEFEENGQTFSVQRSENSFLIFRIRNGNYESVRNPFYFLNTIIPNDMADYFFFQGEGMGSIASGTRKSGIRNAVRDILGFTVAEKALESIRYARTELRKEYQKLDKSSDLSKMQKQLGELESEKEFTRKEIEHCEKEQLSLSERLKEIDEQLRNSNHDLVKQKQLFRDAKEREVSELSSFVRKALEDKTKLVSDFAISVFSQKIVKLGIEFIDEKELKGKIPAPYNVQLVEDILSEKKCICGADVHPGSTAFGEIQKLMAKAADSLVVSRVTRARSQLTAIKKDLRRAPDAFKNTLKFLSDSQSSLDREQQKLKEISLEISGINFEDIKNKEELRRQLDNQLKETIKQQAGFNYKFKDTDKKIQKLDGEVNRLSKTVPQAAKFQKRLNYTKSIEDALSETLEKTEESIRIKLISEINKFLEKFVRQDFKATISDNYSLELKDRNNNAVGKSDGQTLLLSLTFISALINIAKLRAKAKGNILTPGAIAPFVIDAPFGVLDNTYKANVAKEIPNSVGQVIFLLSSGHWEGTVEHAIREKVGHEYNLVLEIAGDQGRKKIDAIKVDGKTYPTSRYTCEVDKTLIEEIGRYV